MGDIQLAEQSFPATPSAGQGSRWPDYIAPTVFYTDDAGRVWGRTHRNAIIAQSGFATETYVTNSGLLIPSFGVQAQTMLEWVISASKTAAGIAAPIYRVKVGALQSTADTTALTLTGPAQTAIADVGHLTILVTVRSVGAAGVIQGTAGWSHNGAIIGFANNDGGFVEGTSAGFDNTIGKVAGLFVGLTINGGTSAAWTITQVRSRAIW